MPLRDLSHTTETLQTLLTRNINENIMPGLGVTVSTLPPERTQGGNQVLNLYCYHITEDPHLKIRPRESRGVPIASSPLALILHYILTAHPITGSEFDGLGEQRLLGFAMKTLHDHPVIDDRTRVGTELVMHTAIRGKDNRFEISLVPTSTAEALDYWAGDDTIPNRPASYWQVRPVELEAEAPARIPGVVLNLGAFLFDLDGPSLGATTSEVPITLPSTLGGGSRTVRSSPARVGPVATAPHPATNRMQIRGTSLGPVNSGRLLLKNSTWSHLYPDPPRIPVDLSLNPAWSLVADDEGLTIDVGNDLHVQREGGIERLPLYPGVYLATWETIETLDAPDGPRTRTTLSNDASWIVYPRILTADRGDDGQVTLTIGGTFSLDRGRPQPAFPEREPELDILLAVDGESYSLVMGATPDGPRSFALASHTITYQPSPRANRPGLHTIRLLVDGADSQPYWMEIP